MANSGGLAPAQTVPSSPNGHTIHYPSSPSVQFPKRPDVEVRSGGPFGLGVDRQDLAHQRRVTELYHLAVETALAEKVAVLAETYGVKELAAAVAVGEQIVYSYPADTVAGMVAADCVGDMAARGRVRHARLADSQDAEALNIIHRR